MGSSPTLTTPPGWVFCTHSGRHMCESHFPAKSPPWPRPHSWDNLDLTQLGTGWPACVPGPLLIYPKNHMSSVIKWYLQPWEEKKPLSWEASSSCLLSSWGRVHPAPRNLTPNEVWTHFLGLKKEGLFGQVWDRTMSPGFFCRTQQRVYLKPRDWRKLQLTSFPPISDSS